MQADKCFFVTCLSSVMMEVDKCRLPGKCRMLLYKLSSASSSWSRACYGSETAASVHRSRKYEKCQPAYVKHVGLSPISLCLALLLFYLLTSLEKQSGFAHYVNLAEINAGSLW